VIVDLLDVDRDRRVVRRFVHRLFDDVRGAACGERDVVCCEDEQRDRRAGAQAGQRAAAALQAEQDPPVVCADRRRDRDRMRSGIDGDQHGDRPGRPFRQRFELRVRQLWRSVHVVRTSQMGSPRPLACGSRPPLM